jgi:hypothetical protein
MTLWSAGGILVNTLTPEQNSSIVIFYISIKKDITYMGILNEMVFIFFDPSISRIHKYETPIGIFL